MLGRTVGGGTTALTLLGRKKKGTRSNSSERELQDGIASFTPNIGKRPFRFTAFHIDFFK